MEDGEDEFYHVLGCRGQLKNQDPQQRRETEAEGPVAQLVRALL